MSKTKSGLEKAIEAAGSISELARRLETTRQAVSQWKQIPAERIGDVHRVTGVPQKELRPDLFA